jgi:two-component system response regulator AlgR
MSVALRVLIVDDEPLARERLATLLADIEPSLPNRVVGSVGDGLAALDALSGEPADVVLVDIRMPRMGGIEFVSHLRTCHHAPAVIFTTAYDHHAVQAFELNAVDYLLKPIRAERLLVALKKVVAARSSNPSPDSGVAAEKLQALAAESRHFFSCQERGKLLLVPVAEVLYLRADAKYVVAKTVDREYLLDESLLKLEEEFASSFLRLHRSVLVAQSALAGFEKTCDADGERWVALLRGLAEKLPVSRRQWPLVKRFAGAAGK